jgi:hypothetical protein
MRESPVLRSNLALHASALLVALSTFQIAAPLQFE